MRAIQATIFFALGLALARPGVTARAQVDPSEATNPQLQLMLSQPPVDINSPVTATAVFDPPVVRVGEKAVYRVAFNALEASLRWPADIPAPAGLEITPAARGQTMHMVGNIYRPLTAVNYRARAGRPGFFTMPAFWVEVYGKPVLVPEARLEVAAEVEPAYEPARQLILQLARTNLFVGERMRVRVLAPGSRANVVEALGALQFNGGGFFVEKNSINQTIERREVDGRTVATFVAEAGVTPIAVGEQWLAVQAFTSGSRVNGSVVIQTPATLPGGVATPVLLDSEPQALQVRPLPASASPNFTGFIGNLTADPPQLNADRVRVGDPLKISITFRSDQSLARLVPPPPPRIPGWQIFPALPAEPDPKTPPPVPPMIHAVTFTYTMIPLTEELQATPRIPFSYFDPQLATYADLTLPGIHVTIVAEGLPTHSGAASAWGRVNETAPEKKSSLSQLAPSPGNTTRTFVPLQMQTWFLGLQLLPALVLAALWQWDRRRRFLAAHPEIVRRRQALRALRREKRRLDHAIARGDAPGFIRSGVTALQIIAAPHYPAEPRALVCGEVLNLLGEGERAGRMGEIIRHFFTTDAAASFAPGHEKPASPFDLRPELERVLQQLEARL